MRNMYKGKWISFLGIPPFTPIFLHLMMVNLQLKPVQKFYRIFPRNLLLAFALVPEVLLVFWLLSIGFPSPFMSGLVGLLVVLSLPFVLLILIRLILRPFLAKPQQGTFKIK